MPPLESVKSKLPPILIFEFPFEDCSKLSVTSKLPEISIFPFVAFRLSTTTLEVELKLPPLTSRLVKVLIPEFEIAPLFKATLFNDIPPGPTLRLPESICKFPPPLKLFRLTGPVTSAGATTFDVSKLISTFSGTITF